MRMRNTLSPSISQFSCAGLLVDPHRLWSRTGHIRKDLRRARLRRRGDRKAGLGRRLLGLFLEALQAAK
jgi:hypothetical protein